MTARTPTFVALRGGWAGWRDTSDPSRQAAGTSPFAAVPRGSAPPRLRSAVFVDHVDVCNGEAGGPQQSDNWPGEVATAEEPQPRPCRRQERLARESAFSRRAPRAAVKPLQARGRRRRRLAWTRPASRTRPESEAGLGAVSCCGRGLREACARTLRADPRVRTRRRGSRRDGSETRSPADRAAWRWPPTCDR